MKSAAALTIAAMTLVSTSASAQPGTVEPVPVPQHDAVDENIAIALSLGGTVASWALVFAGAASNNETMTTVGALGTMFAPGLGHWYSHSFLTRGLGIRALGLGVALVGFAVALDGLLEENNDDEGTASALLLIGAGMYVAGTVDDIAMAPRAARRYNARFENVTVLPQLNPHGGGLALVGRF